MSENIFRRFAYSVSAVPFRSFTDPYPYRGGGRGGTKPTCRIPLFLLGNRGIVIQPLEWNCKLTFLNKPWALVRKYVRLAPEELSASMITTAQLESRRRRTKGSVVGEEWCQNAGPLR